MSDAQREPLDEAVWLLKTIGLDITYTDEGLEAIAKQIMHMGEQQLLHSDDWEPWRNANFIDGYAAGLSAARDAVAAYANTTSSWDFDPGIALAAIDALTERTP